MCLPWPRVSTGPGELTWEAWKVRGRLLVIKITGQHAVTPHHACRLMHAHAGWCIMAAVVILVQVSLFDSKSALWNKSSFIYVTLQSTRCLPPLAGSLLVLGLQGALLLHSSSSHQCPPTLTPTRRPTTTTTCTSLGRRQASARWGPQHSGVSWTCTTPSPRLARSDAFRCPLRGRQPS